MSKLTEMVRDGKISNFVMYRDKEFWYKTKDEGFEFPIPFEEVAGGTYYGEMKSMALMRYIRKQLKFEEDCQAKIEEAKAKTA